MAISNNRDEISDSRLPYGIVSDFVIFAPFKNTQSEHSGTHKLWKTATISVNKKDLLMKFCNSILNFWKRLWWGQTAMKHNDLQIYIFRGKSRTNSFKFVYKCAVYYFYILKMKISMKPVSIKKTLRFIFAFIFVFCKWGMNLWDIYGGYA